MIPAWFFSSDETAAPDGRWDQTLVTDLLAGRVWSPPRMPLFDHHPATSTPCAPGEGCVVVVPGGAENGDCAAVQDAIAGLAWCLLIVTSDEGAHFPWWDLQHPNMVVWASTPHPDHPRPARALPLGATPHVVYGLPIDYQDPPVKNVGWFFSGQITHPRRVACADMLNDLRPDGGGILYETAGFSQGPPSRDQYVVLLAAAHAVPCPGGPVTPDTMRVWEALEAGATPIVDAYPGEWEMEGFWANVFPDLPPFPIVDAWETAGPTIAAASVDAQLGSKCSAWWALHKRGIAHDLVATVEQLAGPTSHRAPAATGDEQITVLVPTSWIPSAPDIGILETTLGTVRERLPSAEILVMVDGLADDHEAHRVDWDRYVQRVVWACHHRWHNVAPVVFDDWSHQATMTRHTLGLVETPLILFVEHDFPLCGDIDFAQLAAPLLDDQLDMLRLYLEPTLIPEHSYLMLDEAPADIAGVPVVRTIQYSQRVHLARTDWYRNLLAAFVPLGARTFIEDAVYGHVLGAWEQDRWDGYEQHRMAIYHPEGPINRFSHADGRAGATKAPCIL